MAWRDLKHTRKGRRVGGSEESSIPWAWIRGTWEGKFAGRNTTLTLGADSERIPETARETLLIGALTRRSGEMDDSV